ncbi:hypothetical protein WJ968_18795 [Achromobacter xylosoxidans]
MDVKANLTSRGGLIQAGNVLYQPSFLAVRLEDSALALPPTSRRGCTSRAA